MKLIRFGEVGREEPGVILDDGRRIDASQQFRDFDEGFFASGGMESLVSWVEDGCPDGVDIPADARIGPPIERPSKIVCVGLNYLQHARESGAEPPAEPVLFMKATTAWSGPEDPVIQPPGSNKLDYETELAIVIGRTARHVEESRASEHIAGFAVMCDVSERAYQKEHGGQWVKGKSYDSFAPMGPWLTPAHLVEDPQALRVWTKVNGELRQNDWTSGMLHPVNFLVSYISRFMTLLPGDVIATGTPAGVGMGMNPPRYLDPGDALECGIEGLGVLKLRVVDPR